jgi:hypothetical protein
MKRFPLLRGGEAAPIKECNATEQKSAQPGEVLRAGKGPPPPRRYSVGSVIFFESARQPLLEGGETRLPFICPLDPSVGQQPLKLGASRMSPLCGFCEYLDRLDVNILADLHPSQRL